MLVHRLRKRSQFKPLTEFISRPTGSIPSLDGLRALSIGLVLLAHAQGTVGFPSGLAVLLHSLGDVGHLGVRVFFVISGFLITTLLLSEKARTGQVSLRAFYLRRFFRIFPVFYVYIIVIACLAVAHIVSLRGGDLLHAFTYTMNYHADRSWWLGHAWSLSVEEQFYIIWPAVIAFANRKWALRVTVTVILLSPFTKFLTYHLLPSMREGMGESFHTLADIIAVGCLLALVREQLGENPLYLRLLRSKVMLALPIIILVTTRLLPHARFSWFLGEPLLNVCIALSIDWCIRNRNGRLGKLLNAPPMVALGVLSYSLYLWQQPFLNPSYRSWLTAFPFNLVPALGLAVCSYLFIERPSLALRRILEKTIVGPGAASSLKKSKTLYVADELSV